MRHAREVGHDRVAGDVLAEPDGERRADGRLVDEIAERDEVRRAVGHLDADGLLARDRREDADLGRRQRVGEVVAQRGDARDLRAGRELQLVARDARARDGADQPRLDAVLGQRRQQRRADALDVDVLALGRGAALQHARVRQAVVGDGQRHGDVVRVRLLRPRSCRATSVTSPSASSGVNGGGIGGMTGKRRLERQLRLGPALEHVREAAARRRAAALEAVVCAAPRAHGGRKVGGHAERCARWRRRARPPGPSCARPVALLPSSTCAEAPESRSRPAIDARTPRARGRPARRRRRRRRRASRCRRSRRRDAANRRRDRPIRAARACRGRRGRHRRGTAAAGAASARMQQARTERGQHERRERHGAAGGQLEAAAQRPADAGRRRHRPTRTSAEKAASAHSARPARSRYWCGASSGSRARARRAAGSPLAGRTRAPGGRSPRRRGLAAGCHRLALRRRPATRTCTRAARIERVWHARRGQTRRRHLSERIGVRPSHLPGRRVPGGYWSRVGWHT